MVGLAHLETEEWTPLIALAHAPHDPDPPIELGP